MPQMRLERPREGQSLPSHTAEDRREKQLGQNTGLSDSVQALTCCSMQRTGNYHSPQTWGSGSRT